MWYNTNATGPAVNEIKPHLAEPPQSHPLDPSKPNVVFIHTMMASSDVFIGQMSDARMRAALNILAFDARWHGRWRPLHSQVERIGGGALKRFAETGLSSAARTSMWVGRRAYWRCVRAANGARAERAKISASQVHQDDFLAAMDSLQLKKYSVVGEGNTGGRIAVHLAVMRPDQVAPLASSLPPLLTLFLQVQAEIGRASCRERVS